MEKIINVQGMHCKSCEMLLNDSISEIAGVEKVSSDSKTGKVIVSLETEATIDIVKKIIEKEGYKVLS